jgi:hypothetical protein
LAWGDRSSNIGVLSFTSTGFFFRAIANIGIF